MTLWLIDISIVTCFCPLTFCKLPIDYIPVESEPSMDQPTNVFFCQEQISNEFRFPSGTSGRQGMRRVFISKCDRWICSHKIMSIDAVAALFPKCLLRTLASALFSVTVHFPSWWKIMISSDGMLEWHIDWSKLRMPKRIGRHLPNHQPFHLNLMTALVNWGCLTLDGEAFIFSQALRFCYFSGNQRCFVMFSSGFQFSNPGTWNRHGWR